MREAHYLNTNKVNLETTLGEQPGERVLSHQPFTGLTANGEPALVPSEGFSCTDSGERNFSLNPCKVHSPGLAS